MTDIPIEWPVGGTSDDLAHEKQPRFTTRRAKNVRTLEAVTGRSRGAQRPGTARYKAGQVSGSNAVKRIGKATYGQPTVTYSQPSSASPFTDDPIWSDRTPTRTQTVPAVKHDGQSNVYVSDGRARVTKFNSEGEEVTSISLPLDDEYLAIRGLEVSGSGRYLWVGVSGITVDAAYTGGRQRLARIYCYRLDEESEDEEYDLLWELKPSAVLVDHEDDDGRGALTEEIWLRGGRLWTIQNEPDLNRAFLRSYRYATTESPELAGEWPIPFPAHGFDLSKDNDVFVASAANPLRGIDPRAPTTTARTVDWTPEDLPYWERRVWSWLKADNIDGTNNSSLDEGAQIALWRDASGNGRHLFTWDITGGGGPAPGPTYRSVSSFGGPSVKFTGGQALQGFLPTTTAAVPAEFSEGERTFLPGYTGSQYVMFAVVKVPSNGTRYFFCGVDPTGDTALKAIVFNAQEAASATNPTTTAATGRVVCIDRQITGGAGLSGFLQDGNYNSINGVSTDDFAIICHVHGNAVDADGFTPQRDMWYVNGHPVADGTSTAAKTFEGAFQLGLEQSPSAVTTGASPFEGEIVEMLVLRDYEDESGLRALITHAGYPTTTYNSSLADLELERLFGHFAHKYGLSHNLSTGTGVAHAAASYAFPEAAGSGYSVGNTLTVSGGSGTAATFTVSTVDGSGGVTSVTVATGGSYTAYPSSPSATTGGAGAGCTLNVQFGNFPHAFYIENGPPRLSGVGTASVYAQMNDVSPLLSKFDSSGDPKWCVVGEPDTTAGANAGVGGIGWGVRVSQKTPGAIYSIGPTNTISQDTSATTAEELTMNAVVRKILDNGDDYDLADLASTTWEDGWGSVGARDDPQYQWPRMAVGTGQEEDRDFDTLSVPVNGGSITDGFYVYLSTGATVGTETTPAVRAELPDGQKGLAVSVDPNPPVYLPKSLGVTYPEKLAIGASGGAGEDTVFLFRLVYKAQNSNQPRAVRVLAVSAGNILVGNGANWSAPAGSFTLDSAAVYVDYVEAFGKGYFTDGRNYLRYTPDEGALGTLSKWGSKSSGRIPEGATLCTLWNGRVVIGRFQDDPQNWACSAQGDPDDWDFIRAAFDPRQAFIGNDSQTGRCPDAITALCPIDNDTMVVGCDHTLQLLRGDPGIGGKFDLISDITGIAFGRAWCKDPNGALWFFGSRGGLYYMPPGALPQRVTLRTIEQRLRDIDLLTNTVELQWNWRHEGLHVFVIPKDGSHSSVVDQYFFDVKNGVGGVPAPWPDTFPLGKQVTCSHLIDGDDPDDRIMLLGCEDGRVRYFSDTARSDDDGNDFDPIKSEVLIGPLGPPDAMYEQRARRPSLTLAGHLNGARADFYASRNPDVELSDPLKTRELVAGPNPRLPMHISGRLLWIGLANYQARESWAFEGGRIEVYNGRRVTAHG